MSSLARSQTFTAFDTCNTKFTHRMSDCKRLMYKDQGTGLRDVPTAYLSLSLPRRPHSLEPLSTPVLSLAEGKVLFNAASWCVIGVVDVLHLPSCTCRCTDRRAWRLCYFTILWLVVAVTVWLSDRINCNLWLSVGFPYLHSLWHIFAFLASYIGCVLCAYLHASREAPWLNPQIHYWPSNHFEHGVPYVYIKSPMTARYST